MTAHPPVEPDPFDKEIEAMLCDPAVVARLDAIAERRENGTLVTYGNNEARKIVGLEPEPGEEVVKAAAKGTHRRGK